MRYERLTDLLRLAIRMQGRADGLSLDDIGEEFEVSRRTAERMRDAVMDAFPNIEELREPGGRKRWRFPGGTLRRFTDPTIEELAALGRGAQLAAKSGDAHAAKSLEMLCDRLRARLAGPNRARLEPDIAALVEADGVALRPGPREDIAPHTFIQLRDAILAGVWVEVDHRARASGDLSRNARLGPIAMLLGQGRQYLVAYSSWANDVRLFALAGFDRIDLMAEPFERPADFDLSNWLERSFGVWQEQPYDVEWRFTPKAAPDARSYLFHPGQTLRDEPDGSLTVTFRAGGLREMCWHLFRWGGEVAIISPPQLKEEMAEQLRNACAAHAN